MRYIYALLASFGIFFVVAAIVIPIINAVTENLQEQTDGAASFAVVGLLPLLVLGVTGWVIVRVWRAITSKPEGINIL
jgi:uncharacterized membrane protein